MTDPRLDYGEQFDLDHNPTWRIFRIMSEFVEGFSFLARMNQSVTFFGSARLSEENPYYQLARNLARRVAEEGFAVVTGGGPGIMQAGNQGAYEAGGESIGLNIELPFEQRENRFVKRGKGFNYFFSRKVMLAFSAEAYVFFPGGFGTLDEFFELVTLRQTGKLNNKVPLIMMGRAFWEPLANWIETTLLNQFHTISPSDLHLWTLTDDIEEAVRIIKTSAELQQQDRLATSGRAHETPNDKLKQATRPMTKEDR